jgi:hypothetical protein
MSSIRRVRHGALLPPLLALVLLACGGNSTATEPPDSEDPGSTDVASLPPAGERSFMTWDGTGGRLVRIDPDTLEVDDVYDPEGTAYTMAQGDGALWLGLDSGTVVRVDPANGSVIAEIAPTSTDDLFDIAVGGGAAWALHGFPGAGTALVRIDTATNTAGEPIAPETGVSFYDVEADANEVWLVGTSPTKATTLYAVDPATGELTDQDLTMIIKAASVADGAVWLAGTVFPEGATTGVPGVGKYDPAAKTLTTVEVGAEPISIAAGAGAVWAATGVWPDGTTLYRVDPETVELAATIPVGETEGGLVKVSTGPGAVWVTTAGGDAYQVDPADDSVVASADAYGTLGRFFP